MDGDERPADRHRRIRISATSRREILPQHHDRKEADDADGDEGAFNESGCDIAESERFVLPLEDRNSTTAVPTLAMIRKTSSNAPNATRVSAPAPTM
jgi:hypothetical protein